MLKGKFIRSVLVTAAAVAAFSIPCRAEMTITGAGATFPLSGVFKMGL